MELFGQGYTSVFFYYFKLNLLVLIRRQTLGSHRATDGALLALNRDCEAHRDRRVKQYRPDYRGTFILAVDTKYISVNLMCEKFLTEIKSSFLDQI